jgi:hypothetical protein
MLRAGLPDTGLMLTSRSVRSCGGANNCDSFCAGKLRPNSHPLRNGKVTRACWQLELTSVEISTQFGAHFCIWQGIPLLPPRNSSCTANHRCTRC